MRLLWPAAAAALVLVAAACSEPTAPAPALTSAGDLSLDLLGGCPDRFVLGKGIKITTDYKVVGRDPIDDNQDGYACQAITKEPVYYDDKSGLKSQGVVVLIDNNIPPNAIGKCPVTFTAVMGFGAAEDLNGNLVTCEFHVVDEGGMETGVIVVDDTDH